MSIVGCRIYSKDEKNYCVMYEELGMIYIYETKTNRLVGSEELSIVRTRLRSMLKRGKLA